ncbi:MULTISPECIES: bifunctional 2-polyprenyl-6-hydroxyphenol methylase/3-demethylubiquinol 3-O-methyltransferase UbiG [unclassified Lentimicrobium]|uniref:class I SAM-dependent methyltransferase n=1 Tax=unclassified Lentimicrobium TaxID=2677434 RepID=UPI0015551E88|nr:MULTISPECIES: class I SAM-dependent methyltransferase [unclassified Lentimicrobium]NPD44098.1 class I SAM-dependent methyltransferase [Lentimicrobium sp. S6]NPD86233.1 class I SAM-dependent methyltransferase [Lentimicrobium sp. L6]
MASFQTAERHSAKVITDNVLHQRHMIAYDQAAQLVSGHILEVGCGEGYGMELLAPKATKYMAIDKYNTPIDPQLPDFSKITFQQMNVPPFDGIEDNTFDFIVSFQVIEHIEDDDFFSRELFRVLKPGGKLILTTPNIKMSLTRNPWHIREYKPEELFDLLNGIFHKVEMKGIFGNEKVMEYYEANKKSVRKFTRFDVLNLQYKLPRSILQIPYDILNRMNRKKLHKGNTGLSTTVKLNDYYLADANDQCLDLFMIAQKKED